MSNSGKKDYVNSDLFIKSYTEFRPLTKSFSKAKLTQELNNRTLRLNSLDVDIKLHPTHSKYITYKIISAEHKALKDEMQARYYADQEVRMIKIVQNTTTMVSILMKDFPNIDWKAYKDTNPNTVLDHLIK